MRARKTFCDSLISIASKFGKKSLSDQETLMDMLEVVQKILRTMKGVTSKTGVASKILLRIWYWCK